MCEVALVRRKHRPKASDKIGQLPQLVIWFDNHNQGARAILESCESHLERQELLEHPERRIPPTVGFEERHTDCHVGRDRITRRPVVFGTPIPNEWFGSWCD